MNVVMGGLFYFEICDLLGRDNYWMLFDGMFEEKFVLCYIVMVLDNGLFYKVFGGCEVLINMLYG